MMAFYKRNPKRYVIILFTIGIICFLVSAVVSFHIPERINRNVDKEIKTPEGTYEGNLEFGIVSGEGRFTWNNKDSYSGDFSGNEIDGKGKLIFSDGGNYSGEFQDGIRSGSGEFKWSDGKTYVGDWSNDNITGEGTITYTNGDTLEGYFTEGKFISGVYTTANSSAHYRIVFDQERVTNVKIEYANGIIYNGEYKDNAFNGEGTLVYSNGDKYSGQFIDGKKVGNGEYTWNDGSHYTGNWKDDKMDGEGEYFYPSGSKGYKLKGNFTNNRPDGILDYYISESKSYETDWSNGKCIKLTE